MMLANKTVESSCRVVAGLERPTRWRWSADCRGRSYIGWVAGEALGLSVETEVEDDEQGAAEEWVVVGYEKDLSRE